MRRGNGKKQWVALALSAALLLSELVPVYAVEEESGQSGAAETEAAATVEEPATSGNVTDETSDSADGEASGEPSDEAEGENEELPTELPSEPAEPDAEGTEEPDGEQETEDDDADGPATDLPVTLPLEPIEDEEITADEDTPTTLPLLSEDDLSAILPDIGTVEGSEPTEVITWPDVPQQPETVLPVSDVIEIASLEELARIGTFEDYPLDGTYDLLCDISGGAFAPIGSRDEPFSGIFYGNGHVIAGLAIDADDAGFFASLTGEVRDLTLTGFTVTGGTAGILAAEAVGATIDNVLVTGTVTGETAGAVAGIAEECEIGKLIYFTGTNLPAAGEGECGALMLRSQPPYIAIVLTQTAQLAPDAKIGHFAFSHFDCEGFDLDESGETACLIPLETGKFTLTAVYAYDLDGEELELRVAIPVIISEDAAALAELSTLDGVFYEQLGDYEVVQLSALEPLQLLEGVFAETILKEQQVAVSQEIPINKITSWEDFKNIGNTDYDPDYTMFAVYLLDADIYSDGEPFTPIGTEDDPFYGEFDGRTFVIDITENPEIDTTLPYSGLFGVVLPPPETEEDDISDDDFAADSDADSSENGDLSAPEADGESDASASDLPDTKPGDPTLPLDEILPAEVGPENGED